MMAACQMRRLSSLELMLVKLQRESEEQRKDDEPPPLPARPVMRARLRRARKKLPLNLLQNGSFGQENGERNDLSAAFLDSEKRRIDEKERAVVKGVEIIQRCYHAYQARQYYHQLKTAAIALQSFVRVENARKDHQRLVTRLRAIVIIQKHMKEHQTERRDQQLKAVICLQSGIRGWLTRQHFENKVISHMNSTNPDLKDDNIKVQVLVLLDLERRVAITEAALERRRNENDSLKKYILQFHEKSQQYEAKMQFMEKAWQDQLTSIQTNLAAGRGMESVAENGASRIDTSSQSFKAVELCGLHSSLLSQENVTESGHEPLNQKPDSDLQKLKLRFKGWKKDYKSKLQVVKSTLKQLKQ